MPDPPPKEYSMPVTTGLAQLQDTRVANFYRACADQKLIMEGFMYGGDSVVIRAPVEVDWENGAVYIASICDISLYYQSQLASMIGLAKKHLELDKPSVQLKVYEKGLSVDTPKPTEPKKETRVEPGKDWGFPYETTRTLGSICTTHLDEVKVGPRTAVEYLSTFARKDKGDLPDVVRIYAPSGVGKSWLAMAIANLARTNGLNTYYCPADLFTAAFVNHMQHIGPPRPIHGEPYQARFLVLDELGKIPAMKNNGEPPETQKRIHQIINAYLNAPGGRILVLTNIDDSALEARLSVEMYNRLTNDIQRIDLWYPGEAQVRTFVEDRVEAMRRDGIIQDGVIDLIVKTAIAWGRSPGEVTLSQVSGVLKTVREANEERIGRRGELGEYGVKHILIGRTADLLAAKHPPKTQVAAGYASIDQLLTATGKALDIDGNQIRADQRTGKARRDGNYRTSRALLGFYACSVIGGGHYNQSNIATALGLKTHLSQGIGKVREALQANDEIMWGRLERIATELHQKAQFDRFKETFPIQQDLPGST